MFHCPHCREALSRAKPPSGNGYIWACQHCGGRAVSLSLLRGEVDRELINRLWQKVTSQPHRGQRPCPACASPMREVGLETPERLFEIDVCRTCHWLWFDPDEFDLLPPAAARLPVPDLPPAAREAVALIEIERQAQHAAGGVKVNEEPEAAWKVAVGWLGLPVEYDNPSQIRPWVTWSIASMAALAFALSFSHLAAVVQGWGFIPSNPWRHLGATVVTSFFLHGGFAHLLGNMYFLLVFGDNVEEVLGRRRFLVLLALATVCGHTFHAVLGRTPELPCVGASGGISGIIVFYALQFPQARLGFAFRYFVLLRWLSMPAGGALIVWLLYQVLGTWLQWSGFSNVSALAHLGGALIGFLCWLRMRWAELG